MRRLVVETLALALLVTGMGVSAAQQPKIKPKEGTGTNSNQGLIGSIILNEKNFDVKKSKLEEMLAEALKNNADIRVAVAKVTEADAELNRTRLLVTQKVVALYYAIDTQQKVVAHEEVKVRRIERLKNSNVVSKEEVADAQQALTLAKAKLAELEAQMPAVLGKVAHAEGKVSEALLREVVIHAERFYPLIGEAQLIRTPMGDRLAIIHRRSQTAAGPMADKIRTALDKPISLKVENKLISEVLLLLQKQTGINIKLMTDDLSDTKVNLELTDISFRAALQYIEDSKLGYHFVVREYGILFAQGGQLPPGALTVQEFLRQKPAAK